jgi:hypothetical protein
LAAGTAPVTNEFTTVYRSVYPVCFQSSCPTKVGITFTTNGVKNSADGSAFVGATVLYNFKNDGIANSAQAHIKVKYC